MAGSKSARILLLVTVLLLRPRLTMVPLRNPFWTARLLMSWRVIRKLVPVVNALLDFLEADVRSGDRQSKVAENPLQVPRMNPDRVYAACRRFRSARA